MNVLRNWAAAIAVACVLALPGWAGEIPQAKPEAVGMSGERLAEVTSKVQKMVDDRKIAGAITMVARRGKIVHFETYGLREIDEKKPVAEDTIMRLYSMTKPITTVAAMMLYDEGKLELDDPVEQYVPELKGLKVYHDTQPVEPDRKVTIRDLMRHTSGLTYGIFGNSPVDQIYKKERIIGSRDLRSMVEKLGRIPLMHQPGSRWHYSVSTDVLGCLVEKVSGGKLDVFFQERIFKPLDMKDTAFFVPKTKVDRFSSCYSPGPEGLKVTEKLNASRYLMPPSFLSGGGGLVSTARDYMRFCQMLIHKGELFGARILKAETVDIMTKNQLPEKVYWGGKNGFGLGFSVQIQDGGSSAHAGEYGWGGAASTHFWISPKDDLAVVALSQLMPFSPQLQNAVKPLVYEALVD
ncbi:MAG TPA: serine hydrolase domain-containing protein [Phycisphaerae bacterium]|nr:serine hydrolase domain-containing protein [Phycisphaerae bacterium]